MSVVRQAQWLRETLKHAENAAQGHWMPPAAPQKPKIAILWLMPKVSPMHPQDTSCCQGCRKQAHPNQAWSAIRASQGPSQPCLLLALRLGSAWLFSWSPPALGGAVYSDGRGRRLPASAAARWESCACHTGPGFPVAACHPSLALTEQIRLHLSLTGLGRFPHLKPENQC